MATLQPAALGKLSQTFRCNINAFKLVRLTSYSFEQTAAILAGPVVSAAVTGTAADRPYCARGLQCIGFFNTMSIDESRTTVSEAARGTAPRNFYKILETSAVASWCIVDCFSIYFPLLKPLRLVSMSKKAKFRLF